MIIASRTQFHVERLWGQPGEGPSRGLLRDCTTSPINRFAALFDTPLMPLNAIPAISRVLDFKKVKQKERDSAKQLYKSKEGKTQLKDIQRKAKTFTPGEPLPEATNKNTNAAGLSPDQVTHTQMIVMILIEQATKFGDFYQYLAWSVEAPSFKLINLRRRQ